MSEQKFTIATIGSHSALQILRGAKDEGFPTLAICLKGKERPYKLFGVADEIISVNSYAELPWLEKQLAEKNAILIPHASFFAYTGIETVTRLNTLYYGNKSILKWEASREMQRRWLDRAGLKLPQVFTDPADIDRPVIVKFSGARGGKGYFLAKNEKDFDEKIRPYESLHLSYMIQEYIIGVPVYAHYFKSSLTGELEIMGFDKRYESNVDSLGRISARDQLALTKVDPSYVVVGNVPLVVRESFLPAFIEMGEDIVKVSKDIAPPKGLFGPFCLETIMTPDEEIFVFEISARIVAGTNPYAQGSPYTWIKYGEPMSTGRRIAREIRQAIETNQLEKILDNFGNSHDDSEHIPNTGQV